MREREGGRERDRQREGESERERERLREREREREKEERDRERGWRERALECVAMNRSNLTWPPQNINNYNTFAHMDDARTVSLQPPWLAAEGWYSCFDHQKNR